MDKSIRFPHLGIYLSNVGKSIHIGGFEIAYYGIVIACAMVLGLCLAMWVAKKTKQDPDLYFDVALYAIPIALVGARLYYVIFSWDQYKDNLIHILYIREGGLAIYGGVIAAVITFYVYVKIKKENFWLMVDTGCVGLVLGQIIGRWGNFFNQEAFGCNTNSIFGMTGGTIQNWITNVYPTTNFYQNFGKTMDAATPVHPCFLYESFWCLLGFVVLAICGKKFRKFDGQIFIMYIGWYGLGRFFIEGLRVDSLVIGNMRISQLIAGICVVVSVILLLVIGGRVRRMGSDYQLYCNTEACKQMMAELDAKREASGKKAAASVALDSAKEPEDETSEPEETSEAKTDAPEENDK